MLVAFGASNAEAVAATLIYRFLTIVPTLVLGLSPRRRGRSGNVPPRQPRPKQRVHYAITRLSRAGGMNPPRRRGDPVSASSVGELKKAFDHRIDLVRHFELVEVTGPHSDPDLEVRLDGRPQADRFCRNRAGSGSWGSNPCPAARRKGPPARGFSHLEGPQRDSRPASRLHRLRPPFTPTVNNASRCPDHAIPASAATAPTDAPPTP